MKLRAKLIKYAMERYGSNKLSYQQKLETCVGEECRTWMMMGANRLMMLYLGYSIHTIGPQDDEFERIALYNGWDKYQYPDGITAIFPHIVGKGNFQSIRHLKWVRRINRSLQVLARVSYTVKMGTYHEELIDRDTFMLGPAMIDIGNINLVPFSIE